MAMRAGWIWGTALILYGAFSLWYNNLGGPLSPAEIEVYAERFQASGSDPERQAAARAFLEADDGGEFFMVNLVRLHEGPVAGPDSDEPRPAQEVLGVYTGHFMPALFARAGHVAFAGRATGRYLEAWGVEPMLELATDPAFEPAHAYKIAAMANTLAFPVAPAMLFFGPRVWVGLLLALIAALGHLVLRRRPAVG
jgi:hypothetical protein